MHGCWPWFSGKGRTCSGLAWFIKGLIGLFVFVFASQVWFEMINLWFWHAQWLILISKLIWLDWFFDWFYQSKDHLSVEHQGNISHFWLIAPTCCRLLEYFCSSSTMQWRRPCWFPTQLEVVTARQSAKAAIVVILWTCWVDCWLVDFESMT